MSSVLTSYIYQLYHHFWWQNKISSSPKTVKTSCNPQEFYGISLGKYIIEYHHTTSYHPGKKLCLGIFLGFQTLFQQSTGDPFAPGQRFDLVIHPAVSTNFMKNPIRMDDLGVPMGTRDASNSTPTPESCWKIGFPWVSGFRAGVFVKHALKLPRNRILIGDDPQLFRNVHLASS